MEDISLQVNIGSVSSICGKLNFSFVIRSNGTAHVQIYGSDPSDGRKAGILLTLDESQYRQLKEIISKTDETIERLRSTGQFSGALAHRSTTSFAMIVEDAFHIKGRGTVVTGRIERGTVKIGDRAVLDTPSSCVPTTILAVERYQESVTKASAGETVGLLLSGVSVEQARPGVLVRSGEA